MVESVLEGVGKSEKTVDEEFEMYYAKYQSMMNDLNECTFLASSSCTFTIHHDIYLHCRRCWTAHCIDASKGILSRFVRNGEFLVARQPNEQRS